MNPEEAREKLLGSDLKATQQRITILISLNEMDNHPTADDVYNSVVQSNPGITKSTVYNILESFVEAGLVRKLFTTDGVKRFDPKMFDHGHIYSDNTGEVTNFYDKELEELLTNFFKRKKVSNFKIKRLSLHIVGEKPDENREVTIK